MVNKLVVPQGISVHSNSHCVAFNSIPNNPPRPHGSIGSVQDLRTGGRWFDLRARDL